MKNIILSPFKKLMSNQNKLTLEIDKILVKLHQSYEKFNYDMYTNGEKEVLQRLAKIQNFNTIFDVGANQGHWSTLASNIFPQSTIHSFEIVPETYGELVKNCRHRNNITCHDFGLSDQEELAALRELLCK
jgi:uncharacterized HAD superfamily protein